LKRLAPNVHVCYNFVSSDHKPLVVTLNNIDSITMTTETVTVNVSNATDIGAH